MTEFEKHI